MSGYPEENFKRLFAQAPVPCSDEVFVATIAADVARRRAAWRTRRVAFTALLCMAALALALLLAPFAPVTPASQLGSSLLELPDHVRAAATTASHWPGALYMGIALAAVALPLAGAAWLARRSG